MAFWMAKNKKVAQPSSVEVEATDKLRDSIPIFKYTTKQEFLNYSGQISVEQVYGPVKRILTPYVRVVHFFCFFLDAFDSPDCAFFYRVWQKIIRLGARLPVAGADPLCKENCVLALATWEGVRRAFNV